jgi:hypothetical protein
MFQKSRVRLAALYSVEFGGIYDRAARAREGLEACRGAAVLGIHHRSMGVSLGCGLLAAPAPHGLGLASGAGVIFSVTYKVQ